MRCVAKYLGIAAIALGWSMGVAQAQGPLDPSSLRNLIPRTPAAPGAATGGSGIVKLPNVASPPLVNGANYRHCYAAVWYTDQTNHYVFGYNTEGDVVYFFINSPLLMSAQAHLQHICGSGHAYYVYQQSTGPYFVYDMQYGF
jgi:hypothetical protein